MQINDALYNPILPQVVLSKVIQLSNNQEITEITVSVISKELIEDYHPKTELSSDVKSALERRIRKAVKIWRLAGHIKTETKISKIKTAYQTIIPIIL